MWRKRDSSRYLNGPLHTHTKYTRLNNIIYIRMIRDCMSSCSARLVFREDVHVVSRRPGGAQQDRRVSGEGQRLRLYQRGGDRDGGRRM